MIDLPHRYALGLVVGKFSPLHRGHELLIEAAARQCERLLVLSYSQPEYPRCEAARRRRWLAQCLAPHECHVIDAAWLAQRCSDRGVALRPLPPNDAPDAVHQHYLAWLLREVLHSAPDAMFAGEAYVHPCVQVLSAALGHSVAGVLIDRQQHRGPSGRTIRHDPQAHAMWLAPPVRAAFVRRVAVLGGESSGKTTLTQAVAEAYGTVWAPEYGRELWEQRGGRLDEADLLRIAQEQIAREEQLLPQAHGWLFCDTSPLTTLGYAGWMFGRASAQLQALAQRPYDVIVLCGTDSAFVQDGTRRGAAFRQAQHEWYLRALQERGWAHFRVTGSVVERVAQVHHALEAEEHAAPVEREARARSSQNL